MVPRPGFMCQPYGSMARVKVPYMSGFLVVCPLRSVPWIDEIEVVNVLLRYGWRRSVPGVDVVKLRSRRSWVRAKGDVFRHQSVIISN